MRLRARLRGAVRYRARACQKERANRAGVVATGSRGATEVVPFRTAQSAFGWGRSAAMRTPNGVKLLEVFLVMGGLCQSRYPRRRGCRLADARFAAAAGVLQIRSFDP
jgi:hypothetical protein